MGRGCYFISLMNEGYFEEIRFEETKNCTTFKRFRYEENIKGKKVHIKKNCLGFI